MDKEKQLSTQSSFRLDGSIEALAVQELVPAWLFSTLVVFSELASHFDT